MGRALTGISLYGAYLFFFFLVAHRYLIKGRSGDLFDLVFVCLFALFVLVVVVVVFYMATFYLLVLHNFELFVFVYIYFLMSLIYFYFTLFNHYFFLHRLFVYLIYNPVCSY